MSDDDEGDCPGCMESSEEINKLQGRLDKIERVLLALVEGTPEPSSGRYVDITLSSVFLRHLAAQCDPKNDSDPPVDR